MIPQRELARLRAEWTLDQGVIEKDYILGWLLAGIAQHEALKRTWVFKGGTRLRKCYYETFRFSEDLDFTIVDGGPEEPDDLRQIFSEIAKWVQEESGIDLILDDKSFQRKKNKRGHPTTQGRIAYRGPNGSPSMPKVKLDLTSDEILVHRPVLRPIGHPYSDSLPVRGVASYSIVELFGEKLRALVERCRPRDLYDVVHMHRHPDLIGQAGAVRRMLERKCAYAGIEVPTAATIKSSPFRAEIENEWDNMLGHQLPKPLPPFERFWATIDDSSRGLLARSRYVNFPGAVGSTRHHLGGAEGHDIVAPWGAAGTPSVCRRNRLMVDIDYRAEQGRRGPRRVEPYSLRRTQDGNLVLFVVNDYGQLRSYGSTGSPGFGPRLSHSPRSSGLSSDWPAELAVPQVGLPS